MRRFRCWRQTLEDFHERQQNKWLKARLELLAAEKEFTRQRDALTRRRMAMPWERVEKSYEFEGPNGALSLTDLFEGRTQLTSITLC